MTTPDTLQEYEAKLLHLINQQNKNWYDCGQKLAQVQSSNLFLDHHYKSFTAWLKAFSKQSDVGTTKLWKCLKVYKMIDVVEVPLEEVSTDSINGLAKIAQIYQITQSKVQAKSLIEDFVKKKIKIKELTDLNKSLVNKDGCDTAEIDHHNLVNENEVTPPNRKQIHKQIKSNKWLVSLISFIGLTTLFAFAVIQKNIL